MDNNPTNGHGLYKRETILGIVEPASKNITIPTLPNIIEIRAIKAIDYDGETYLNAKDVCLMLKKCSYKFASPSVFHFVRRFILDLIS